MQPDIIVCMATNLLLIEHQQKSISCHILETYVQHSHLWQWLEEGCKRVLGVWHHCWSVPFCCFKASLDVCIAWYPSRFPFSASRLVDCFCVSCFSPASVVVFSMFYDICLHWLSRYISVWAFLLKKKKPHKRKTHTKEKLVYSHKRKTIKQETIHHFWSTGTGNLYPLFLL